MSFDISFSNKSSLIHRLKYTFEKKLLEILFKNGNTHFYHNVPREIWDELKEAESQGKYFFDSIRHKFDFSLESAELEGD
ncbi:MAG: KTSC domain-containing protein [Deltaproteobacteria bacterium]|nr:KTSC domain-containing protein [Deltaproteobacteria bacterium]